MPMTAAESHGVSHPGGMMTAATPLRCPLVYSHLKPADREGSFDPDVVRQLSQLGSSGSMIAIAEQRRSSYPDISLVSVAKRMDLVR